MCTACRRLLDGEAEGLPGGGRAAARSRQTGYSEAHDRSAVAPHAAFFARRPTWAWKPDLIGATDRPARRGKYDQRAVPADEQQGRGAGRTTAARLAVHEEDAVLLRQERVWRLAGRARDILDCGQTESAIGRSTRAHLHSKRQGRRNGPMYRRKTFSMCFCV
jgi:hypothetical protein